MDVLVSDFHPPAAERPDIFGNARTRILNKPLPRTQQPEGYRPAPRPSCPADGAISSVSFLSRPAGPAAARRGLAVSLILLPLASVLAGCSGGVLDPQGPIGDANKTILLNSLQIMLAIVVPTIVVALGSAWWFRASNARARYQPEWAYSGRIELIVWSIPLLVIMFLGGLIWIGSHQLDPARPIESQKRPLEVQVVSLDWKWLFIYPDQGIAAVNQLVVPTGTPVHFSLTSASVMNVFFVPQLGSMIYTMNAMVTQLHLQANRPGDYFGMSAQYSGAGFSDMNFMLRAVPEQEFAAWVETVKSSGPTLDRTSYAALAPQSKKVTPFTYRSIDPDLFHAIVTQEIPPAPGPPGIAQVSKAGGELVCSAGSTGTQSRGRNRFRLSQPRS